jgi:hypothetical protein
MLLHMALKKVFFARMIFAAIFFCAVLNCMDLGIHKTVEAVFEQKDIMCKAALPQCDLQSLVCFAATCKSLHKYSFENICSYLPDGSVCFEDFKKLELDCCKLILQRNAGLNNFASFNCLWNVRKTELEDDLKQLSGLSTLEFTPEMAMQTYQENYKKLEKKHEKETAKIRAQDNKVLRSHLFYGTAGTIKQCRGIFGEVDAFEVIPRGTLFKKSLHDNAESIQYGGARPYKEGVFFLSCRHHDIDIALPLLGKYIANNPNDAAHYLLEGHYYRLFAQIAERKRIDVNLTDRNRWSALHHTARYDAVGDTILLLQCGALVNAVDKKGRTPLHIACKHGALQVIQTLLCSDGIDPHKKDLKKREPQDLLSKKNAMVRLLIEQHDGTKGKK